MVLSEEGYAQALARSSSPDKKDILVEQDSISVLIVDDSDDVRDFLRLLFTVDGFEVVGEAMDAKSATAAASELCPDLIVLDYLMPEIDGAGAAKLLRKATPNARILGFSAALSAKPDWADEYVPKDRITDVLTAAEELMGRRVPG